MLTNISLQLADDAVAIFQSFHYLKKKSELLKTNPMNLFIILESPEQFN
jgi:hypothetical protein